MSALLTIPFILAIFTLFSIYKLHLKIHNEGRSEGFLHKSFVNALSLVLTVASLLVVVAVIWLLLINTHAGNGLGLALLITFSIPILVIGLLVLKGFVGHGFSDKFTCQSCGVNCGLNWGDADKVLCEDCSNLKPNPSFKRDA
jgi:hypothetical protein